jgi:membrane protein implicated in regulation of membrane protease activity
MRGFVGLVLLVLVVGTIIRFAVWIALAAGIVLLAVVLWKFTGWLDRRLEARELKHRSAADKRAAIAHRADVQNAQVLVGDDRGIYGDYSPKQTD